MRKICKRSLIALTFLVAYALTGHTQLLITPQLSPTGILKKDQLWNIVVMNNNDQSLDVQLQVSMIGIKSGVKVLNGSSRVFTLTKGVRQLQVADLGPVQYDYASSEITDHVVNGLLPVGEYQVCYTLFEQSGKNMLPAIEQCMPVEITPLSPPQLNNPQKGDTLSNRYPQFQWIPPAPMNMFSDLNYELLLVEINKGQSTAEAIQKNTPLFHQYAIRNMFFPYPSSATALEQGKKYAWQIIARNGSSYAEKTESWDFTIAEGPGIQGIKASGFPRLQQGTNALYYIFENQLQFAYTNIAGDSTATLQFFREHGTEEAIFHKSIHINPGENLIREDLLKKQVFWENELYRLEITDSRGSRWAMLLKYQPVKP